MLAGLPVAFSAGRLGDFYIADSGPDHRRASLVTAVAVAAVVTVATIVVVVFVTGPQNIPHLRLPGLISGAMVMITLAMYARV